MKKRVYGSVALAMLISLVGCGSDDTTTNSLTGKAVDGYLSGADWDTFNSKQSALPAGGTVGSWGSGQTPDRPGERGVSGSRRELHPPGCPNHCHH